MSRVTMRQIAFSVFLWCIFVMYIVVMLPGSDKQEVVDNFRKNMRSAIFLHYREIRNISSQLANMATEIDNKYRRNFIEILRERRENEKFVKALLRKVKTNRSYLEHIAKSIKNLTLSSSTLDRLQLSTLLNRDVGSFAASNRGGTTLSSGLQSETPSPNEIRAEYIRRMLERTLRSLWDYVRSNIDNTTDSYTPAMGDLRQNIFHYYRSLKNKLHDWESLSDEWRRHESKRLADLVQSRIVAIQNPKDCRSARIASCNLSKYCGLLCQMHHVAYCLVMSLSMGRVLTLDDAAWRYDGPRWQSWFQPLSKTCNVTGGQSSDEKISGHDVVEIRFVETLKSSPPQHPLAIPEDIAVQLSRFHAFPAVWWVGQVMGYVWRLQPTVEERFRQHIAAIGFKRPIVGVHVRRTDKLKSEAQYHEIDEYMTHVEEYYAIMKKRVGSTFQKHVYLATDEPSVVETARGRYIDYRFIADPKASQLASNLRTRYSRDALQSIIYDVTILSMCDYLVCTFSSHVCRAAYELMQTRHPDASTRFYSLDDIYYYGGQPGHATTALESHEARSQNEISFVAGDIIDLYADLKNGTSIGTNTRTKLRGHFPSYKITERIITYDFTEFSNV